MGIANGGYGRCLDCGEAMRLIFDEEIQAMRAEKWDDPDKN